MSDEDPWSKAEWAARRRLAVGAAKPLKLAPRPKKALPKPESVPEAPASEISLVCPVCEARRVKAREAMKKVRERRKSG